MHGQHDIRRFGAVGDGEALDTAALQQAIDACHAAGGGTVLVPPGTWLTGTIYLKSRVNLHLAGAPTGLFVREVRRGAAVLGRDGPHAVLAQEGLTRRCGESDRATGITSRKRLR